MNKNIYSSPIKFSLFTTCFIIRRPRCAAMLYTTVMIPRPPYHASLDQTVRSLTRRHLQNNSTTFFFNHNYFNHFILLRTHPRRSAGSLRVYPGQMDVQETLASAVR